MNLDTISKRLLLLIEKFSGGNKARFSRITGIPTPSLQKYVEENRLPAQKHLISIQKNLDISIDWLLAGEGLMIKADQNINFVEEDMSDYNRMADEIAENGTPEQKEQCAKALGIIGMAHRGLRKKLKNMGKQTG